MTIMLVGLTANASIPVKKQKVNNDTASVEILDTNVVNSSDVIAVASDVEWGSFAAGLLLGLIGVALVHIFSSNKVAKKSSWYGFGAWLVILLLLGGI